MNYLKVLAVVAILLALVVFVFLQTGQQNQEVSKDTATRNNAPERTDYTRAPDFEAEFAVNGKPIKLSDLRGKIVLLDFWAVWCGPCVQAIPHLTALRAKYKDRGLEIVGVAIYNDQADGSVAFDRATGKLKSVTSMTRQRWRASLKDFAEYHKIDYLLVSLSEAEQNKIMSAYGVHGIPRVVLIDRGGGIREAFVGSSLNEERRMDAEVEKLVNES
jgi:thiol-disulfide isomerase/thioredoxin